MNLYVQFFLLALFLPLAHPAIVGRCSRNRKSNRCTGAKAFWQYDGVCIDDESSSLPMCHVPDSRHFKFYLVAAVQRLRDSLGEPSIKDMWVRGAGPGLSWEIAARMTKAREGFWIFLIDYISDSNALLCQEASRCTLNQQALEVRFYLDEHGMDDMLGPNMYVPLPVSDSLVGHAGFSPPDVFMFPWFNNRKVFPFYIKLSNPMHVTISNYMKRRGIEVTVFYPPSYEHNLLKRYPVVIIFGNNLKKQIVPMLESMYSRESSIEEAFVLGMHGYYPAPYCELNPFDVLDDAEYMGNLVFRCPTRRCIECMGCLNTARVEKCSIREFDNERKECGMIAARCVNHADSILDDIQDVVIPEMSVRTMDRLKVDYPKDRISILGIDGGGVIACYAALSRPDVYKNAACFSAPFHWPLRSVTTKESRKKQGIGLLFSEIADNMKLRPELQVLFASQQYWIDVGEFDNDYLPIVDEHNYSDWVVEQMKTRLKINNILYYRKVLGAGNNYHKLRVTRDNRLVDRLKLPLQWFLKPDGGFNDEHPRTPILSGEDYSKREDEVARLVEVSGPIVSVSRNFKIKDKSCKEILLEKQAKTVPVSIYLVSIGEYCTLKS